MATTERLNSELNRLIDIEQSLFQYQMALLKQAAQEYELKFDSKSCSVPADMAYVIYAGGDFIEDTTLTEIYWDQDYTIYIEAQSLMDDNIVFQDRIESFQPPYLDVINALLYQLDHQDQ
jgi:hypothetical protein